MIDRAGRDMERVLLQLAVRAQYAAIITVIITKINMDG
jgi:hypothetical protein